MTERVYSIEDDEPDLPDLEEGILPGVDLDLGSESDISGGDDLAHLDEANLYGNDVMVADEDEEPEEE